MSDSGVSRNQHRRFWIVAPLLFAFVIAGSVGASALNEDQVYKAWEEAGRRFEARHPSLGSETEESKWVWRVGDRIVASWPDRRWVDHRFRVIVDAKPKAWSFPVSPVEHRVYATTGLLQFVKEQVVTRADDALAGVLGHEIAHLMRDHHLQRAQEAGAFDAKAPKELEYLFAAIRAGLQQDDEFEADQYGALYALHAGYRFQGITDFLTLYRVKYGDEGLLDDLGGASKRVHPSLQERIGRLEEKRESIEKAERLFAISVKLLRVGSWSVAADCFAEVRKSFPASPTVVHNLAYAELKRYETSVGTGPPLEQQVSTCYFPELRPKGAPTVSAALLLAEAKAGFLRAAELDRSEVFAAPRLGLICAYLYEGEDAKAQACLQEMRVGLDEPEYQNLTGVVAERAGDAAAAQRAYLKALGVTANGEVSQAEQAVQRSPSPHLPALHNLARLCEQKGATQEARRLYDLYLAREGDRGVYATRAQEGLRRCGGAPAKQAPRGAVNTYCGIDLRVDGPIVVKAALGQPESHTQVSAGRGALLTYDYPSRGIQVMAAAPDKADAVHAAVQYLLLQRPHRDPIAGVRIGDSLDALQNQLGLPREVTGERDGAAWWDYPQCGVGFRVVDGSIEQCLIGGGATAPSPPKGAVEVTDAEQYSQDKWAIVVGVQDYAERTGFAALKYADKDAQAVHDLLVDPQRGGYEASRVRLLTTALGPRDQPTIGNILGALGQLGKWTQADPEHAPDTVLVYFSGHGVEEGKESYLIPADADPDDLAHTGLPLELVREKLTASRARKQIIVVDACRFGAKRGKAGGDRQSLAFAKALEQFADAKGRVVLASCGSNQASYEDDAREHSAFTGILLEGLLGAADQDGNSVITLTESYEYLSRELRAWARERGVVQHPNLYGEISLTLPLVQCPKWAELRITSTPDEAEIWIDGVNTGKKTPDTVKIDVSAGRERKLLVRLSKEGYEDLVREVELRAAEGKMLPIAVDLSEIPALARGEGRTSAAAPRAEARSPDAPWLHDCMVEWLHSVSWDGSESWGHRMHAAFDDPLGPGNVEVVTITAPNGMTYRIPSGDSRPASPGERGRGVAYQQQFATSPAFSGLYNFAAVNRQGKSTMQQVLVPPFSVEFTPNVTYPPNRAVIDETAPVFSWQPIAPPGWLNRLVVSDVTAHGQEPVWTSEEPFGHGQAELSIAYNRDGTASQPRLIPGHTYILGLQVHHYFPDGGGVEAWRRVLFTVAAPKG